MLPQTAWPGFVPAAVECTSWRKESHRVAEVVRVRADRASGWYEAASDGPEPVAERPPRTSGRTSRPSGRSARPLDARGYATAHHILVQLGDAGLRPRFAETCKAFGDIIWCDDLEELRSRAAAREALAVVVDAADRSGIPTTAAVAAIRQRRPDVPIVLWCDRAALTAGDLAGLAGAGLSAAVFRGESDVEQRLMSALTRATDVAFHQLTDQALARRVPSPLIPIFRTCLDRAPAIPRVAEIAATAGLTARQLTAHLRRAGMPPMREIVRWSRVLTAAYRLEQTTEPLVVIAHSVGFVSASYLARLLKRYANETPDGLREPGGFGWVLRCFERYLVKRRGRPLG
jgi:AraC-like DNA-binding protein